MFFLLVFDIVFDVVSRKLYSRHHVKRYGLDETTQKVILISAEEEKVRLRHAIETYGYKNDRKEVTYDCTVIKDITNDEIDSLKEIKDAEDTQSSCAASGVSFFPFCMVIMINNYRIDVLRHLKVPSSADQNPGSEPPGIFLW